MENTMMNSGVRKALEDTIAWCSLQSLTATPAISEEIRRQRERWRRANTLDLESYRKTRHASKEAAELRKQVNYRSLALLSDQLRSQSLNQGIEIGEPIEESQWRRVVNELIVKRRELLNARRTAFPVEPEHRGKLLVYLPKENLVDGAAELASEGFFDQNNIPPWDTWFHFDGDRLFSWVPDVLVPLAHEGISANPEECIQWAEWSALNELEA